MAEAGEQSENGDRRVKIQSRSEPDCGEQREQFRGRDLEDVEHSMGKTLSRTTGGYALSEETRLFVWGQPPSAVRRATPGEGTAQRPRDAVPTCLSPKA